MFDFLIIGAGAAGSVLALKLKVQGKKVLLVDKEGIFGGASGAAGAFFSPKLGKNYPLDTFINDSLVASLHYFKERFPNCLDAKGVLMLPKSAKGGEEKFHEYEPYIKLSYEKRDSGDILKTQKEGFWFQDGAILDVDKFGVAVQKAVDFEKTEIKKIEKEDKLFICDGLKAKNVVIATGASDALHPDYVAIKPVYGYRFECHGEKMIPWNLNGDISVSATRTSGSFALGATHYRSEKVFQGNDGSELLAKAREELGFAFEVLRSYSGARATSIDHFPIIGGVANLEHARLLGERYLTSKRWRSDQLRFHEGLYVLNGLGARGFVYAPRCADLLIDYMLMAKPLPKVVDATRLLFRYFRKGDT